MKTTKPETHQEWPILYKDILRLGNLDSHVGVCTLWTERDVVQQLIKNPELYSIVGNLYSAQGINAMIRNIMANPRIRTVVIWGAELSMSGHSLKQLIADGVDEQRRIIKGRGEIEVEIPDEALAEFRKSVEVIDLRGRQATELVKVLETEKKHPKKPFAKAALVFPPSQPVVRPMPSEQVGFRAQGKTVAQTWLKLLNEINKYGRPKHTRYSQQNELKEILNLTTVVTDEDTNNIYYPQYLPFERSELEAYYPEMTSPRRIPGVAYNYGYQMMKHFGIDQIDEIKKLLKKRPDSKKMLALTIDPKEFWGSSNTSDTPCLTMVNGSVQDNKFFLTAHFRSQDMVHGWPRNAFGLRRLQKQIADSAELGLAPLTIITHSAHIYSDDFRLVENVLMEWYEKEMGYSAAVHFDVDYRGNVVVEVVNVEEAMAWPAFETRYKQGETVPYAVAKTLQKMPKPIKKLIRATLYEPNGGPPIKTFEGRVAQEVAWQITDYRYLTDPGHLMYVGLELQKAEESIKQSKEYEQDPA